MDDKLLNPDIFYMPQNRKDVFCINSELEFDQSERSNE